MRNNRKNEGHGILPTLADIAEKANVSKATVSIILNQRKSPIRISEATRERVIAAAKELNYVPNRLARAFSLNRAFAIGIITPSAVDLFDSAYSFGVMKGIVEMAQKKSYNLMIFNEEIITDPRLSDSYAHLISERHVDGVVIFTADYLDEKLAQKVRELKERKMEFVNIWRQAMNVEGPIVGTDNISGAKLAIDYLVSLGHRKIAIIARGLKSFSSRERLQGALKALKSHGIELPEEAILFNDIHPNIDQDLVKRILALQERPTALFVLDDPMAINVINILSANKIKVPNDMSVIGFGDVVLAEYSRPSLTTVREPLDRIGSKAAQLLIDKIEKKDLSDLSDKIYLKPELVMRNSCQAP